MSTQETDLVQRLERELAMKRNVLRDIYLCRLARGNGTICRSCWERADRERFDHTARWSGMMWDDAKRSGP